MPNLGLQAVVISKDLEEKWELVREKITLGKMLGAGNYGEVYKATFASPQGKMVVAVKTVKEESMGQCFVGFELLTPTPRPSLSSRRAHSPG